MKSVLISLEVQKIANLESIYEKGNTIVSVEDGMGIKKKKGLAFGRPHLRMQKVTNRNPFNQPPRAGGGGSAKRLMSAKRDTESASYDKDFSIVQTLKTDLDSYNDQLNKLVSDLTSKSEECK